MNFEFELKFVSVLRFEDEAEGRVAAAILSGESNRLMKRASAEGWFSSIEGAEAAFAALGCVAAEQGFAIVGYRPLDE